MFTLKTAYARCSWRARSYSICDLIKLCACIDHIWITNSAIPFANSLNIKWRNRGLLLSSEELLLTEIFRRYSNYCGVFFLYLSLSHSPLFFLSTRVYKIACKGDYEAWPGHVKLLSVTLTVGARCCEEDSAYGGFLETWRGERRGFLAPVELPTILRDALLVYGHL